MTGLAKHQRLLNKADFNGVFSKSVKVSNAFFLILIHKTSTPYSRLGLVISKKVDKRAVQRNRVKRICRETFRKFVFESHCDYVVLARPNITKNSNKDLTLSLNQLWEKTQPKIQQIRKNS